MKTTDIYFYKSRERQVARYRSDLTVFEECLHGGRFIGLYWSCSGQCHNEDVVDKLPGRASLFPYPYYPNQIPIDSFKLEIDGQSLHSCWEWAGSFERPGERKGTTEAVVKLKHRLRKVSVNVVTCLDGSPVLVRYLEITNTGENPAALSHISVFSGLMWDNSFGKAAGLPMPFDEKTGSMYSLGYFKSDAWGQEGDFTWVSLNQEAFKINHIASDKFSWPYYILRNEVTGESFFAGLGWSGNYNAEFLVDYPSKSFNGNQEACLFFNIGPSGPAPLRVISPGETVVSPQAHIGPMHCNLDKATEKWHGHLRASVIPPRPSDKKMYTIAGRVVEKPGDWILREIDIAAEMGVEAFMVDAGWYGKEFSHCFDYRGDWNEGGFLPESGLKAVREYTRKKGMLFGLWMEPESLGTKCEIAKAYPDWKLVNDRNNPYEFNNLIDLSNAEAANYVEESILKVIKEYELDFYKTDYNQRLPEGGLNWTDGFAECEEWRHYETLYRIYDRVLKEFPNMALENCAAGGGRNDLGMLSRFHYACESDWSIMPYSLRAINAMTLFIPPEAICYYHNHMAEAHLAADIDTHLRITLFATPIFVGFGPQNTERNRSYDEKTKRYIELGKGFCREVMANSPIVYHHTPYIGLLQPADWCVLEYASPDHLKGYAGIFRLSTNQNQSNYTFIPRGVNTALVYEVTMDNAGRVIYVSGYNLVMRGLTIYLENTNTSELIIYRAIEKLASKREDAAIRSEFSVETIS